MNTRKSAYVFYVLAFLVTACAPHSVEAVADIAPTPTGLCYFSSVSYYLAEDIYSSEPSPEVPVGPVYQYAVDYTTAPHYLHEGEIQPFLSSENDARFIQHREQVIAQVSEDLAVHGYGYFSDYLITYRYSNYAGGATDYLQPLRAEDIQKNCTDGVLDLRIRILLRWEEPYTWSDTNVLNWARPTLVEMLDNKRLDNTWVEEYPLEPQEKNAAGTFVIDWTTGDALDFNLFLHQIPGVTIYYMTLHNITYGAIVPQE